MTTSTRIAVILGLGILFFGQLRTIGNARSLSQRSDSPAAALVAPRPLAPSGSDSLEQSQSGLVREKKDESLNESLPSGGVSDRLKLPLHERLFPQSRILSEEQSGPDDEGVITKIQLLKTGFKFPLVRLEQRWKGDQALPPVAMVANHIMVERKDGMSDEDFRKGIEGTGLNIDKMLPDSNVYILSFDPKDVHTIDGVLAGLNPNMNPGTSPVAAAEPDYIRFIN